MSEFKNLKFQSVIPQDILQAVGLLGKIGYETEGSFSADDAARHNGVCAWDDGEITEGWLDDDNFEQVTLEGLIEMVMRSTNNQVLWLNKETLEERWLHKFYCFIDTSLWVRVPDGATFATGDKDNFVFRKDGWYYEDGEWVETNVLLKHFPDYKYIKLFWVKSNVKDNVFTLERLLGCEVKINYSGVAGYVTGITNNGYFLHICCGSSFDVVSKYYLTFFTEDGDELVFDEYVERYYGGSVWI